jgi:hypothetical protein
MLTDYTARRTVKAGYNTIPMSIMLYFAGKYGKIQYKSIASNNKSKIPDELKPLADDLLNFAKKNDGAMHASAANYLKYEYKDIRRNYVHWSAYPYNGEVGIVAWLKDSAASDKNNNPKREIING